MLNDTLYFLNDGLNIMQTKKTEDRKKRLPNNKKTESIKQFLDKKKSIKEIASECNVSEQTIRNWVKKYQNIDQADITEPIKTIVDYVYANIVPLPLVYTLEEAASVAKISIDQLLYYAALGKITLFIDRPIDLLVFSQKDLINQGATLKLKNTDSEIWSRRKINSFKPPFLVINDMDCKKIGMGFSINKKDFDGVFLLKENEMLKQEDLYFIFKEDLIDNIEIIYINQKIIDANKDGTSINISKNLLKLSSKDLNQLIEKETQRKANRKPSQEPFAVHKNKSSFLVALDQAAFELWGDFNPIKAAIFNTSEKIAEYLQHNFNFCKANAQPLAVLITPSAENRILPSIDSKEMSYRPRLLSIVIQAWEAVCMSRVFDKGANSVKYEDDARKWLMDKCPDLTKYAKTVSNVVKLLTPDNAPFEKLRKAKK